MPKLTMPCAPLSRATLSRSETAQYQPDATAGGVCVVRESPIHGRGVFASRGIRAGGRVLEYLGERISHAEAARRQEARHGAPVFLFTLDSETVLDGDIPDNTAKFINHSCDENCEVSPDSEGRLWIHATRDIPATAELTFDYAFPLATFFEHPCRCGSPTCPGFIVSRIDRSKLRRLLARRRGG